MIHSPSSSRNNNIKASEENQPNLCSICAVGSHESKVCPWMYSRCKHIPCNGIRQLLRSKTTETEGEMFFRCSNPTCRYFEWFALAIDVVGCADIKLLFKICSCACGEAGHSYNKCPLRNLHIL